MVDPQIFVVRLTADHEVRARRMGGQLIGTKDITELGWTAAEFDLTVDTTDISPEEAYRQITDAMEEVI
jgi:chloramphenicol 3-O-phosphotransferase